MAPDFDNLLYEFVNLQLYDTSLTLMIKIDELVSASFCRHKDPQAQKMIRELDHWILKHTKGLCTVSDIRVFEDYPKHQGAVMDEHMKPTTEL